MKTLKQFVGPHGPEWDKQVAFVKKIHAKGKPNPVGHNFYMGLKTKDDDAIIVFKLKPFPTFVHIEEIVVTEDKGRKGFGTHVLKMITKEADKDGIELHLFAVPLDHAGKKIPKGKLQSIYKKHGFKLDRADLMVRMPK